MKLVLTSTIQQEMYAALERAAAMYELLIAHSQGQTDLTEDQLANVVETIGQEARDTLSRARGRPALPRQSAYHALVARRRPASRRRRARGLHS